MWKYDENDQNDQVAADWPQEPIPLPPQPQIRKRL
jgi:hypothetical protein